MKNLLVLAVATLFATSAFAAEMKWNGSAGWRYTSVNQNDQLNSVDNTTNNKDVSTSKFRAHQIRANLGVMGGWEHVEYGFGLRTGGAGTVNDDYVTVQQGQDRAIGLEQAWFRYVRDFGSLDLGLTVGRQKNVLATDSQWETLFDNDVRWDGFGWNFKFGMFGLNAAQYVLGSVQHTAGTLTGATRGASSYTYTDSSQSNAQTTQRFQMLYAFQPYMNWKFSDEIEAMFSVGYYKWVYEGDTNAIGGGLGLNSNAAGTVPVLANGNFKMDNKAQWDFLLNVSLPYNLAFTGDYVKSDKAAYNNLTVAGYAGTAGADVSSSAWTLGMTYGKLRKAQDFTIGYAYTTKGIGSVYNTFANDRFRADDKGHTVLLGYSMADNLHLGFRWMSLSEKERIAASGAAATDGSAYAGTKANQQQKVSLWELTAGVAF